MGTVVEFPVEDVKLKQLESEITKAVAALETKYNELDALHEMLNSREAETNGMEQDFNGIIKQYIDKEGIENTPALWLTYSSKCIVKATADGEYEMIWLEEDDE